MCLVKREHLMLSDPFFWKVDFEEGERHLLKLIDKEAGKKTKRQVYGKLHSELKKTGFTDTEKYEHYTELYAFNLEDESKTDEVLGELFRQWNPEKILAKAKEYVRKKAHVVVGYAFRTYIQKSNEENSDFDIEDMVKNRTWNKWRAEDSLIFAMYVASRVDDIDTDGLHEQLQELLKLIADAPSVKENNFKNKFVLFLQSNYAATVPYLSLPIAQHVMEKVCQFFFELIQGTAAHDVNCGTSFSKDLFESYLSNRKSVEKEVLWRTADFLEDLPYLNREIWNYVTFINKLSKIKEKDLRNINKGREGRGRSLLQEIRRLFSYERSVYEADMAYSAAK
jgi:hypothetical protein